MITQVEPSPLKMKRFRVLMDNGKHYDFGLKGGSTFIDHHDTALRERYLKRHLANATEKKLNDNLIASASLFSRYLLWGRYKTIGENINYLNGLWKLKHNKMGII